MKKLLFILLIALSASAFAQTGIGTTTPNASAQLDVSSTTKGFLPPRMTAAQRTAISTPAAGLLVYQTDGASGYYFYNGTSWILLSANGVPYTGATSNVDLGTYTLISGGLLPKTDLTYNLGSSSIYWNDAYIATNLRTQSGFALRQTTGYSVFSYGSGITVIASPDGDSNISLNDNGTSYAKGNFVPNPNNTYALGSSTNRWTYLYATNGTIQTSDARLKENILPLSDKYVQFIRNINPVEFDWISDKNGKHMGVTVQQTEKAMLDAGLNPADYFIINKENPDAYSMSSEQLISPLIKYAQNLEQELNTAKQEIITNKQELADLKALLKSKGIID